MKAKEFDSYPRLNTRRSKHSRRSADGPNIGAALLGAVCVAGVFGVLTLLYHFG
jgi:hypothetical protein